MKTFQELVDAALQRVEELFPWDLEEETGNNPDLMLLDIREPYEYDAMHIQGALNVPRGILETSCEFDYEETVPELASARERDIIVICRSGKRSALDRFEQEQLDFFEKVRAAYLERASQNPERFVIVDAGRELTDVQQQLDAIINTMLTSQEI